MWMEPIHIFPFVGFLLFCWFSHDALIPEIPWLSFDEDDHYGVELASLRFLYAFACCQIWIQDYLL